MYGIRVLCLLAVLAVLLSGCGDAAGGWSGAVAASGSGDLNADIMQRFGYQTSTAEAQWKLNAESTEQAAREQRKSEREIAVIMAPVHAKETEIGLALLAGQATDIAAVKTATATAQAATAVFMSQSGTATVTAAIHEREIQDRNSLIFNIFWGLGMLLFLVGSALPQLIKGGACCHTGSATIFAAIGMWGAVAYSAANAWRSGDLPVSAPSGERLRQVVAPPAPPAPAPAISSRALATSTEH